MRMTLAAVMLLSLCPPLGAAKAVLDAPAAAPPGALVRFDAAGSEGQHFAWLVDPDTENFAVDSSGRVAYLATPCSTGRYLVILAVADQDGLDVVKHELLVGHEPEPDLQLDLQLPAEVKEGSQAQGKVTRDGADGDLQVKLESSDPGELAVPASATIPDGQAAAAFTMLGVVDKEQDGDQQVNVVASAGNVSVAKQVKVVDTTQPEPGPEPAPVKKLWVLILYESNDVDDKYPWLANVLDSRRLWDLAGERVVIKTGDMDERDEEGKTPPSLKPWIEMVRAQGLELPRLFLVDQDGHVRRNLVVPRDVKEIEQLVRRELGR